MDPYNLYPFQAVDTLTSPSLNAMPLESPHLASSNSNVSNSSSISAGNHATMQATIAAAAVAHHHHHHNSLTGHGPSSYGNYLPYLGNNGVGATTAPGCGYNGASNAACAFRNIGSQSSGTGGATTCAYRSTAADQLQAFLAPSKFLYVLVIPPP